VSSTNRRKFIARSIGVAAATSTYQTAASAEQIMPAFGNRAHIFAPPDVKDDLIRCFSVVLGCGAPIALQAPGLAQPILAFKFPGGGSLSVEFTEDALDLQRARRGAWMEIWSGDPAALKKRVLAAGFAEVNYPATNTFYFAAPGGQVLGIVSARNPAGGELKTKP